MLDSSNMLTVIFWMENDNYKSIAIVPAFVIISHKIELINPMFWSMYSALGS